MENHCIICNKVFEIQKNNYINHDNLTFDNEVCLTLFKKFVSIYGKSFIKFVR